MMRLLRFLTGVVLMPLCVAVTLALLDVLRRIPSSGSLLSPETAWLLTGYFLWLGLWFFMPRPVRAYVIAHELTHVLWGLLFGARFRDFQASTKGGSVRLSKSNMLITLAPYFFPFYTILVILLRLLADCFVTHVPFPFAWLFLVGFTWGFHVTFTVQSLMTTQPDILEYGRLFSYVVIYLFNLTGVGLWVVCTTPVTLGSFASILAAHTVAVYASVSGEILSRAHALLDAVKPKLAELLRERGA